MKSHQFLDFELFSEPESIVLYKIRRTTRHWNTPMGMHSASEFTTRLGLGDSPSNSIGARKEEEKGKSSTPCSMENGWNVDRKHFLIQFMSLT
jgi:hypothetical protein